MKPNTKSPEQHDVDSSAASMLINGTCEDELETTLPFPVNFDYKLDENGNQTLYIPNIDSTKKTMRGRDFNRVEYDQTCSHMHHAPDHGIPLPANFDMAAYKSMNKAQKIAYVKKNVPRRDIIDSAKQ